MTSEKIEGDARRGASDTNGKNKREKQRNKGIQTNLEQIT